MQSQDQMFWGKFSDEVNRFAYSRLENYKDTKVTFLV
jgi:hypothetical protein